MRFHCGLLALVALAWGAALLPGSGARPAPPPIWQEGFEVADRGAWQELQACCAHSFHTVPARLAAGARVGRFEVRPGDALEDGTARAQLSAAQTPKGEEVNFTEGMDRWFGWSMRLANTYPTDPDKWAVLMTWKDAGEGEGPLKLGTSFEPNTFRLEGPGGDRVYWRGPLVRGAWLDFLVRVKFSTNPSIGFIEVWYKRPGDNELVRQRLADGSQRMQLATMEPGTSHSYLKTGIYRDSSFATPSVAWFDRLRIGTSFEAAAR